MTISHSGDTSDNFTEDFASTPKSLGFRFPAEWETQEALWLSWPHKEASWPGKIDKIYAPYSEFIKAVAQDQKVRINVADESMKEVALGHIQASGADLGNVEFYFHPTNDAWCRDHGPAFVIHEQRREKAVVDWGYNAWGGKYPPYDLDDVVPTKIAQHFGWRLFTPSIVMEGGSVEFNGAGTVMTTEACLLNPNRNPHLDKAQIEKYLLEFYGQEQVLWLGDGIVGDDTDGHIDDITRFVNKDTVLTVIEENPLDDNYQVLQDNLAMLEKMRLADGSKLNVIPLPMPKPVIFEEQRLPASYANFYIANKVVVVPVFGDANDERALAIIQQCFPDRKVVGIDSVDIIWGLGSFHCLSQQEPAV